MDEQHKQHPARKLISKDVFPWLALVLLGLVLLLLMKSAFWRAAGAGAQVQVPMFYDAHYLFPRPWTQDQAAPGVPEAAPFALYGENRVSQTFVSGADKLAMISIWLAGSPGETVKAILSDDAGILWQEDIILNGTIDGQEYRIAFPSIADSKGRSFTFSLAAPGAAPERPVVLRSVGGDRLGEALRLNEFSGPGNLALATYSRGNPGQWWIDALAEQFLPSVFRLRLQQYKPAPIKGMLFSWLLIITAALSAVLLVIASPQRQEDAQPTWSGLLRSSAWFLLLMLGSFLIWQIGSGRAKILFAGSLETAGFATTDEEPPPGEEPRLMVDLINNLWTAEREPEARFVTTELVQGYPAIRVPADSQLRFAFTVAPDSYLRTAAHMIGEGEIQSAITVNGELLSETVISADEGSSLIVPAFVEYDLDPWAGQGVVLALDMKPLSGNGEGLWIMPQILTEAPWLLEDIPRDSRLFPVNVQFDGSAELIGVTLNELWPESGESFSVGLIWRPLKDSDRSGKVFVHLIDGAGRLITQHDGFPVNGAYPMTSWQPGALILDEVILPAVGELTPGPYRLEVGVYDPASLERWNAVSAEGSLLEEGKIVIDLPDEDKS